MFKSILAFTALIILASVGAHAQDWPGGRPIRVILPLTGGSGTDTTAPGTTPDSIVDRSYSEAKAALELPELKARLAKLGEEPMPMTRKEFADFVRNDLARNAELIKATNLAPKQ
jgi:tripartite-type tricarboxylate transporter receptor subunit TctC